MSTTEALVSSALTVLTRPDPNRVSLEIPSIFYPLFLPYRYKVTYGGRGGAKSWSIARALITIAHQTYKRILCAREFQSSIKDSVLVLLKDQIEQLGLTRWFRITDKAIVSLATGSEFLFKGLHHNATEIKSTEGVDICWVEEAHLVSKESWDVLIPTIRKEGSEIWVSFNPWEETDETYVRFVKNALPNAWVQKVNWDSNPYFSSVLELERQHMLKHDPDNYEHVWGGEPKKITDAVVLRGKYVIEAFDTPLVDVVRRFFFGVDFGFGPDPCAAVRCYTTGKAPHEELWIDYETGGYGIDIDILPGMLQRDLPGIHQWPSKADNSRPESISYIKRHGPINISAADKWAGSVDDGIAHLRAFKLIHIHARCKQTALEARLWSYKTDRNTQEVLPILIDANNHYWDAVRYALDGFIKKRGGGWSRI